MDPLLGGLGVFRTATNGGVFLARLPSQLLTIPFVSRAMVTGSPAEVVGQPSGRVGSTRDSLAAQRAATLLTWLCVTGVLVFAFVLRFQLVRQHLALGLDPANYLVTMNALFGSDPTGLGLARPPLIAIPMKLFTLVLGTLTGLQALGVFASVIIGIPFFLIAQRIADRYVALIATSLFISSSAYSGMTAWGFLSFFGIFFIILTSYFLLLLLANPSHKYALLTGIFASILVGFHQVSLLQFLLVVVPFMGLFALSSPSRFVPAGKYLALAVAIGGVLSLVYAPMYLLAFGEGSGNPQLGGPFLRAASWQEALEYLAIFYPNSATTVPAVVAALIGLALLWRIDRDAALLLLMFGVVSVGAAFVTVDSLGLTTVVRRLPYLSYIPLWLFAGVAFSALLRANVQADMIAAWLRRVPGKGATLFVAGSASLGLLLSQTLPDAQQRLAGAVSYYNYLDTPLWEAVHWARDNTSSNALFVAHPMAFGWWIEGASLRDVYETRSAASFYRSQEEQRQVANLVLTRNQGLANGLLLAAITDPYVSGATGSPIISIFAADQYQAVALFQDHEVVVETVTGQLRLQAMSRETRLVDEDQPTPVLETVYKSDSITVVRSIRLEDEDPKAVVSYEVRDPRGIAQAVAVGMDMAIGADVALEQTGPDSFLVRRSIRSLGRIGPIVTSVSAQGTGAEVRLDPLDLRGEHLVAHANLSGPSVTVSFHFRVVSPGPVGELQSEHFVTPELLRAHEIKYIGIDMTSASALFNDLPQQTIWWLDQAPYLDPVFQEQDVKIYEVSLK